MDLLRLLLLGTSFCALSGLAGPPLTPIVEIEEEVYRYTNADNGAGPMWCSGSTSLVRIGDQVFASGLETLTGKPLNNCRWLLFKREANGWQLQLADPVGRTREPSPLAGFANGSLFLSANPTLTALDTYSGPARPEILKFTAKKPTADFERLLPVWEGTPKFTEHSYRSLAADGQRGELILFQNIDYTHAEWSFRDRSGKWSAQGQLRWPQEAPKAEPIRVCYPNVALKDGAVHFCGVSDITEPNAAWRAYKKQLTGNDWDYDFRRLFYTWTPDIRKSPFREWLEIASRDKTAGWISPGDLWVAPDGAAHLLWTERAIDERLRAKFFPEAKQSHSLNYAIVRDGKVALRKTIVSAEAGQPGAVASAGRFQVTPDDRLFVVYYSAGSSAEGKALSENRVVEILRNGEIGPEARIALTKPFVAYFTATVRAGSPRSNTVELLGQREGEGMTMSYARVRLW